MKLRALVAGLIIVLLGIAVVSVRSARLLSPARETTSVLVLPSQSPPPPPASVSSTLTISEGIVFFKSEREWTAAVNGQTLIEGNSVRTDPGAHAELTFDRIGQLRLQPQTEITISALTPLSVRIYQTIGDTYSKVKKLFDPASSYEVETPTAVASVRGTAFGVLVDASRESRVIVEENRVDVAPIIQEGSIRTRLSAAVVSQQQGTIINQEVIEKARASRGPPPVIGKTLVIPKEKIDWLEQNKIKDRQIDRKETEQLIQTIRNISSESAEPVPEFDTCTGQACVALCEKPELRERCLDVSQGRPGQANPKTEPENPQEKNALKPTRSAEITPSPTYHPIRKIIEPIREAIVRMISPSPKPSGPDQQDPSVERPDDGEKHPAGQENEREREIEKGKEKEQEKIRKQEPTPSAERRSPGVLSLPDPLSPAPTP